MSKIQVLKLDDDILSPHYVTRGSYYYDADEFINDIAKTHTCDYEIREIWFYNNYEGISDEEFNMYFNHLDSCYDIEKLAREDFEAWLKREEAFEKLWEVGEKYNESTRSYRRF